MEAGNTGKRNARDGKLIGGDLLQLDGIERRKRIRLYVRRRRVRCRAMRGTGRQEHCGGEQRGLNSAPELQKSSR